MKKPTGITLLTVFIAWGIWQMASTLFFAEKFSSFAILSHHGLLWVGYAVSLLLLALGVVSLIGIFKRKRWVINLLYGLFTTNVASTFFVAILITLDFGFAKNAFLQSRMDRGLSVEGVDVIMQLPVIAVMMLAYSGFYLFLAFYVGKNKDYFSS